MSVVTRFAPSPTGFLHIGSARTALFNYLFAKHFGGQFLLRIEDTDRDRSTQEATDAIVNGMKWLGIDWDLDIVFQSTRASRHAEVAHDLVAMGCAYYCFSTQEEIELQREEAKQLGVSFLFQSPWRGVDRHDYPADRKPVIRLMSKRDREKTVIHDLVQGEVVVDNAVLDDVVLLRSDGTPTYMLAVVVDDHDMGVTHIIRGDDHLNNAFKQYQIYEACGWDIPHMAHIPLIHGTDGAKLSKRHGALGVEEYRYMGYLPDALCNYLLRLGWSHGNSEIIHRDDAIKWFDVSHVGRSPARLDFAKLDYVNAHYLREMDDDILIDYIVDIWRNESIDIDDRSVNCLRSGISGLKLRASKLNELAEAAKIYHVRNIYKRYEGVYSEIDIAILKIVTEKLSILSEENFTHDTLKEVFDEIAKAMELKLGQVMSPVRLAITGSNASPGMFDVISHLGKTIALSRL